MAQITKAITVDVAKRNLFQSIIAKQNDSQSRFLQVSFVNEGEPIVVESSSSVIINAERADKTSKSFAGTVNKDGTVTVPLTAWMLELDDFVHCDISIIDSESRKLTSTSFTIEVEAAANLSEDISNDENYDILITLLGDCANSKQECDAATEAAKAAVTEIDGKVDAALGSKADKATTLEGYGITDAYTKEQMSKYLNNKQNKLGWDTVPTQNSPNSITSGNIYTALQSKANTTDVNSKLALKYDASNVETGSGTLECADETIADKLAATFKYQKIGKFCLLDTQIKVTEKVDGDVIFNGLPFVSKSASYSVCSSNYGNVRSLVIPYNNSKLKLIGGITTTTTVAITVIYRIEN